MKSLSVLALSLGMLLRATDAIDTHHPPMPGALSGKYHPPMPREAAVAGEDSQALDKRASTMDCNGYSELCTRAFDKVAYVTTHNAFAIGDSIAANQNLDIRQQLDKGVRALMLDLHDANDSSISLRRRQAEAQAQGNDTSTDLAKRDNAKSTPTLCHASCILLNAGPLVDQLNYLKKFLDENRYEVVTVFLENDSKFTYADMAQPFYDSGLDKYAFTPSSTDADGFQWPTLGEMITKNTRLVVLADTKSDTTVPVPEWMVYDRNYAVQTSYSVKAGQAFDCNPISTVRSLLVMNHFVSVDYSVLGMTFEKPDYNSSVAINTRAGIVNQANLCGVAGYFPNYVTVDFFDAGDVLKAVADINKVNYRDISVDTFSSDASSSATGSSGDKSSTHSGAMTSGIKRQGLAAVLAAATGSLLLLLAF
ncbi:hypothetical protein GGI15_001459 [Coemansia interrupta]|uniref:PLC-like phosphodiesterase n=1 Tax=Coemansia interrupta TaxID=1126814 RepID=A0A9W8HMS6_9FUNG|nr:hypothetical protein GGI15_001459 [Coemansia interrupta]